MLSFSRVTFLIHRYFGIGLGLIVTLWCLSGFVMMYVPYPAVDAQDRLIASPTLRFDTCCSVLGPDTFSDIPIGGARISMWPSGPMLFLARESGAQQAINLNTGQYVSEITQDIAFETARQYSEEYGLGDDLNFVGIVEMDQWTVYGSFNPLRPFYQFHPENSGGTLLYVSSVTGEVVQHTDSMERGLNWVGAVVHWIYPTMLRQNQTAWFWTIVILSGLSLFLSVTGVYIAIKYLNLRGIGPLSPFRGWGLWHHYISLAFGLFTLTWLLSGLLSMTPFSALQGRSAATEREIANGGTLLFDETLRQAVSSMGERNLPEDTVFIDIRMVGGENTAILTSKDGEKTRYNPSTWQIESLSDEYYSKVADSIRPDIGISSQGWIAQQDSYYYSRRAPPQLPAYRVIYQDGERAYFDGISGELRYYVDKPRQWNRWLYNGLHSLDFNNFIRQRPLWDILVLLLLTGVTLGSITGTWLGWVRLAKSH